MNKFGALAYRGATITTAYPWNEGGTLEQAQSLRHFLKYETIIRVYQDPYLIITSPYQDKLSTPNIIWNDLHYWNPGVELAAEELYKQSR